MKTRIDYRDQFRGEPLKAMLALEKYVHERGLAPLEWTEAERWFRIRMFRTRPTSKCEGTLARKRYWI